MKTNVDIDYKKIFEIPELTKIHGEPSTATLLELRNEIRCNAQSVTTTLGGGQYGHLGLVMSGTLYTALPNTQDYIRPANPGPFNITATTTRAIEQERANWEEEMRLWREVEAIERTLVQQIVQAVEPKYLKALRNPITTKITNDVKQILSYLFDNYGKVPPTVLKDMKRTVEDYELDPSDPIDLLFVQVDELADIYTLQRNQLSEKQLIEMAYVVIERAKAFKKDLREWNRKAEGEQTWINFKKHFRNAQQELRTSGDLTVKEAMGREELVNVVTESINNVMMEQNENKENIIQEDVNTINAMISKKEEVLQKQVDDLKKHVEALTKNSQQPFQPWAQPQYGYQNFPPPPQYNPYIRNNRNNINYNGRNRNNRNRRNNYKYVGTGRYCWTHGACDHWGKYCNNKAQGHVDSADFRNTQGGNMNGVRT